MKRLALALVLAGLAIAACDRVVELAPGVDAPPLGDAGFGQPDATDDAGSVPDADVADGGLADAAFAD